MRAILSWYFNRGGEGTGPDNPGDWGSTTVGQINTLVAVHQLSAHIANPDIARKIQTAAADGIRDAAEKLAG